MSEKIYKGIRLEKEVYDYIENKVDGKDFTQKFHNLAYMLIRDLPNIKKELNALNNKIKSKSEELNKINESIQKLNSLIWNYQNMLDSMERVKSSIDDLVDFCNTVNSR